MPVVFNDSCLGLTVQKTVEVPKLQSVQFSESCGHARCCAQDTAEARRDSTGAVLGQVEVCPLLLIKLLKPVKLAQVQYLDKVFLQFINKVADISVVAQICSPWSRCFRRPLRYPSCNTLIRWSMSLFCRSCRYAHCRKPVKLPQVQYLDMVVGTRPCDHAVERATDSVHRPEWWKFQCATETGTHSANCAW